jgi:hypothetical protein
MKNEITRDQEAGAPGALQARKEVFRFGEASVRVRGVDVNTWQCSIEGTTIGYVTYTPAAGPSSERKARDYGFSGYHSVSLEDAERHPATDVNKYPSLRGAVRAVVACHFGGRQYTYIHDNIAILDGKVVPESVFKGRKVIKPILEE